MKKIHLLLLSALLLTLLVLLSACDPAVTINRPKAQSTVTVQKSFQKDIPNIPPLPRYLCGSWASNNAPGTYSTILIYTRLTSNVKPVKGASAKATVHYAYGDANLEQYPVSDQGGYAVFSLALQGNQPSGSAATVDVSFTVDGKTVQCSSAFFTPK